MQPQRFINTYQDDSVLSAWREGIAEASKSPDLKHQLRQRESELLPRFAEHYSKLKALPRRVRRGLQRQWKKSLAGIALLLALGAQPALAATINVGGTCTLIRAINAANKDTTAGGGCTQGAGADRIVLPASSTVTLRTVNNASLGATGLPIIDSVITIAGNNSAIRRAASAPDFQIFAVAESGDLQLQRTTVSGGSSGIVNQGSTTVNNSTISGNTRVGVDSYYALSLTINNSVISRNGSGIFCRGGYTSCVVTNSVISHNRVVGVSLYLSDARLEKNTVSASGSVGIVVRDADAEVIDSTISGNHYSGIGLSFYGSALLTNTTISGNSRTVGGGLLLASGDYPSYARLTNCTVTGNSASQGGGIFLNSARATLFMDRTLVAGNLASAGREVFNAANATITGANFNLFGHSGLTNAQAFVNFTPGGTDITATSNGNRPTRLGRILNTTLANNGGPTKTHAIPIFSPAVDAVTNVHTCPPPRRDQRGVRRPQDGNGDGGRACDIGSFERRPPTP